MIFGQLFLLLRKEWLRSFKRRWIFACIELLVPSILFFTLLIIKFAFPAKHHSASDPNTFPYSTSSLPSGDAVFRSPMDFYSGIAYTTGLPIAEAVITALNVTLGGAAGGFFKPFHNESDMELAYKSNPKSFSVGLVFNEQPNSAIQMKVRFPADLKATIDLKMPDTNMVFPSFPERGPRDDPTDLQYLAIGFLHLQNIAQMTYYNMTASQLSVPIPALPTNQIRMFPFPAWVDNALIDAIGSSLPLYLALSWIYTVSVIVKSAVYEKEMRLTEAMKIMGLKNWVYWMAFYVVHMMFLFVACCILTAIIVGGGILQYSNGGVFFVLLLLFSLSTISFARLMASLFDKTRIASIVSGILYFVIYIPYMFIDRRNDTSSAVRTILCLFNTSAFGFGMKVFSLFEEQEIGVHWSNVGESPFHRIDFTLGHVFMMLIVNTVLYSAVAYYIEQVFPGEYGLPQKPWFFLCPSFWCCRSPKLNNSVSNNNEFEMAYSVEASGNNEAIDRGAEVGIALQGLRKEFKTQSGTNVAVNNLSLVMLKGQITALLGHNGAGKSTTMSMLVGLFPPTAGTASINGQDIRENMDAVRHDIGICPQHNVLWDQLTVMEHLDFYCGLKHVHPDKRTDAINNMLTDLQLSDKRNCPALSLSGGMKRKLSVGIALIGDSSFVILDEPTAGMDPHARRSTWDLLLKHKKGKTILLSSHYMDECDILGDRIAIISQGALKCSGSSLYLKSRFGVGYHLVCVKMDGCSVDKLVDTIKAYCPDVQLTTDVGAELSFTIPSSNMAGFPALFSDLDNNLKDLCVSNYGLSVTTLEEVFIKVTELDEIEQKEELASNGDVVALEIPPKSDLRMNEKDADFKETLGNTSDLLVGWNLYRQQIYALIMKRIIHSKRDKKAVIFQLFLPIIFVVLGLLVTLIKPPIEDFSSLVLSPDMFKEVYEVPFSDNGSNGIASAMLDILPNSKPVNVSGNRGGTVGYITNQNINFQRSSYGAFDFSYNASVVLYNNYALHSMPTYLSVLNNALLSTLGGPSTSSMTIVSHPFPFSPSEASANLTDSGSVFVSTVIILFALAFIPAFYVIFPLNERINNAKHLQFVSGVGPLTYWFTTYIWDIVSYLIPTFMIMIVFEIFGLTGWSGKNMGPLFLLLLLYGLSLTPYMYMFTFVFKQPATAYTVAFGINFFIGIGTTMAVFILNSLGKKSTADALNWAFLIFPNFCVGSGLSFLVQNQILTDIRESLINEAGGLSSSDTLGVKDPWGFNQLGRIYLFMFLIGAMGFFLTICIECRFFLPAKKCTPDPSSAEAKEDDDVAAERVRVMSGQANNDALRIIGLTKQYSKPRKLAVDNISVGVPSGECFGLLGINGAGKSTTFKMLTGDDSATAGDAFINGHSILSDMQEVRQLLGYCPQFDSLIGSLTAEELLTMFARLRGIPEHRVHDTVDWSITRLQLNEYRNRLCGTYSGGNKRKLSTAIALVGSPPVLFLDEPTAGMDAKARRFLWNVISSVMKSGRAVVLTSHNMEEISALCTRLVIMVNGRFCCLGSPQHLQSRFGSGYTVILKVGSESPDVTPVKTFIENTFKTYVLEDEHNGMVQYQLLGSELNLSMIFKAIESEKKLRGIEDYSVSQTTLEQVFLNFARSQESPDTNAS